MRIRIALLAASAVALTSTASFAADLARTYTKAPVYAPAVPIYNWTGFYVGAHIGAAFGGDNGFSSNINNLTGSSRDAAFLGGGQVGADYQFAPNWVVGIEGQISGISNNDRTFTDGTGTLRDRSNWLASVTGRLGYTWGPGMIYATGGAAFRDNKDIDSVAFGIVATDRQDTGYTVGGGFEYMFAPAWSAKVEYQYYNFDTTNVATSFGTLNYKDDLHTVKVGVNYHFNWGGPVVARY